MWQTHEYHFSFSTGPSGGHSLFAPFLFLGVGAGLFVSGFLNFRKLRVIEDTPRIAIRSVPMGFVHARGKAGGNFLLTSPLTRTPCYYYHVRLERWDEQGKSRGWANVHTETDRRVFYLEDETGRVLVNPQSAEYDLPSTYWGAFGPQASGGPYVDPSLNLAAPPTENDLRAYAANHDPAFVTTQKAVAQVEAKYANSSGFSRRIVDHQKRALEGQNPLTGHGSYRITEQCVAAGHEYDVFGTCAQNPQSTDYDDRNLILKGQNERTFVISGFGELRLEKTLKKRALTRIILGGLLMVIMMAFIIAGILRP